MVTFYHFFFDHTSRSLRYYSIGRPLIAEKCRFLYNTYLR